MSCVDIVKHLLFHLFQDIDLPEWASDAFIRKMIGEAIPPLMCKKILETIGMKS